MRVKVTSVMMQRRAQEIGRGLGVTDVTYSNGWLYRFRKRYGISKDSVPPTTEGQRDVTDSKREVLAQGQRDDTNRSWELSTQEQGDTISNTQERLIQEERDDIHIKTELPSKDEHD